MTNSRGFTLLEILVVLVIIGITLSFALPSFGDFGEQRRSVTAAQQFASFVTLVRDEAILESSTLGVRVSREGYEVLRFKEPNTWQTMPQNLFRYRTFPNYVVVSVKPSKKPIIIINATGDMNAFKLTFGSEHKPNIATVVGSINGSVNVTQP